VISAAFTGLLAFLTGTVLPALLAFFSGPVGWTVLAVAAVVAMCIYFREPIGKFLSWAGDTFKKGWTVVVDAMKKPIVAYFNFWMNGWKKAGEFVTAAFTKAKDIAKGLVDTIGGFMKLVFTRVTTGAVRAFNSAINTINTIISNLKNVPFIGEPLKAVGLIPQMKIPKFAQGGIVSRPTMAMVGEGGQSEYIIPESKMDRALAVFAAKAQGAGGGGATINITTGPVYQMGGEQYVTLSDMQAAMQATARGVLGSLRNPTTRISLGLT
jgi:hypothetical protein